MIEPPVFASLDEYGAHLGDVAYWRPYVEAALARSGQAGQTLEGGFEGTYPTLVGDELVVKLFGYFPGWRDSSAAEIAANRADERIDGISAPRIVASGALFEGNRADWPYLIMERLQGQAWRDATLGIESASSIAGELGRQIRRLHDFGSADLPPGREDWIAVHGADAAERHRSWGSLPEHLVEQIPAHLGSYRERRRCLVHGDLTEDHLFVSDGTLLGVIDWGDAMITDPFYDLGALHLGAFAGDRRLLGCFLSGYGWPVDEGFVDHALQVALMHQFDLFGSVSDVTRTSDTLGAVARELWTPII